MQEMKEEMGRRIETLEKRILDREDERENLLKQIADCDRQIREQRLLASQYREALRRLAEVGLHPDPIAVVRMSDTISQVEADRIHRALASRAKAKGGPIAG
jgi:Mg2+ and Co2+ transporter CorA